MGNIPDKNQPHEVYKSVKERIEKKDFENISHDEYMLGMELIKEKLAKTLNSMNDSLTAIIEKPSTANIEDNAKEISLNKLLGLLNLKKSSLENGYYPCKVDDSGIYPKPLFEYIGNIDLEQSETDTLEEMQINMRLELPCTKKQLFEWAERNHFNNGLLPDDFNSLQKNQARSFNNWLNEPDNRTAEEKELCEFYFDKEAEISEYEREIKEYKLDGRINALDRNNAIRHAKAKIEEIKCLMDIRESEFNAKNKTQDGIKTIDETVSTPPTNDKPRKKLIPLERERNEALLLIYELLKWKGLNLDNCYLEDLPAIKAWGLIVSKEFKSDSVKTYPEHKNGTLLLNGGEKLTKTDFTEKYRKRFK